MPAPRKQSPSSPATSPAPGGPGVAVSPGVAARIRQLAAQAEHHRAVAEFRARHATPTSSNASTPSSRKRSQRSPASSAKPGTETSRHARRHHHPADACTPNVADSCADSVAANNRWRPIVWSSLRPDGLPRPVPEVQLSRTCPHPRDLLRAAWEPVLGPDPSFGCQPGRAG
jgi:hypothetical protein